MICKNITELIGNTPLFLINPAIHGLKNIDLYAKLESYNPVGSVKDRIAWGILKPHLESIKANRQTVIESSSGNTAKAMQALCSLHGIKFKTVTNRIKIPEVKGILQLMGAQIEELPGLSECPDPTDPNDPLSYIENIIKDNPDGYFHTAQYTNEDNYKSHYETTGPEIHKELKVVDYFIGGLGTAGSTRGTLEYLKEKNPDIKGIGVVSSKHDFIPGIRNQDEMLEVGIFDRSMYYSIEIVESLDAIEAMLMLIRKVGILCGPTSGASYTGALSFLKGLDSTLSTRKTAVFVVCDRVESYISYIYKRRPDIFDGEGSNGMLQKLSTVDQSVVKSLTPHDAMEWAQNKNALIVDLRGSLAFKLKHIPGSINFPEAHLRDVMEYGIPFDKDNKILFVCPQGEQSRKYASYLKIKGFYAANLDGGMLRWQDEGLPLEQSKYE